METMHRGNLDRRIVKGSIGNNELSSDSEPTVTLWARISS
jgi:hypothetical protein